MQWTLGAMKVQDAHDQVTLTRHYYPTPHELTRANLTLIQLLFILIWNPKNDTLQNG